MICIWRTVVVNEDTLWQSECCWPDDTLCLLTFETDANPKHLGIPPYFITPKWPFCLCGSYYERLHESVDSDQEFATCTITIDAPLIKIWNGCLNYSHYRMSCRSPLILKPPLLSSARKPVLINRNVLVGFVGVKLHLQLWCNQDVWYRTR